MAKYLIGNIKGPKGDRGEAGPTYTAGTGIDITNNVISATGSGGITTETDPVFSASPAAGITAQDITDWDAKSDFSGSYNDLTNKPDLSVYATTTALGTGLARKQDTLTAGTNITIDANNVISAAGGGGSSLPDINSGDALKVLGVNLNGTGTEWVDTMRGCKINGTDASGLAPLVAMLKENKAPAKLPKYLINGYEVYYLAGYGGLNSSNPGMYYAKTVFDYNQLMFGNYINTTFVYLAITFNSSMDITNVATTTLSYPLINIPNPRYNKNKILAAKSDGSGVEWITAPSGGTTYTAGEGLQIDGNNEISVDTDVVPLKADLANYATQTQLTNGLATKQDTLTGGTGVYINNNQINVDVMAMLNAGTGITLSDYDNSISIDNSVVALKSDIPAANTYGDADVADYISDTFGMGVSNAEPTLWGQTSDPQYIGEDSAAEITLTGSGSSDPFQNGGNTQYPVEFEIRQNSNDELVSSVNDTFLSQFTGSEYSPVYHFSSEDGNKSFDLGYYSEA